MFSRRARILLGVVGEGHKGSLLRLARGLSEAGFEVIYTDIKDPQALAAAALQESVDHVGITVLEGAGCESVIQLPALLRKAGAAGLGVSAGGCLDDRESRRLKEAGFIEVFPKGTAFDDLIDWSRKMVRPAGEGI